VSFLILAPVSARHIAEPGLALTRMAQSLQIEALFSARCFRQIRLSLSPIML
jgi:hypothetical protein